MIDSTQFCRYTNEKSTAAAFRKNTRIGIVQFRRFLYDGRHVYVYTILL